MIMFDKLSGNLSALNVSVKKIVFTFRVKINAWEKIVKQCQIKTRSVPHEFQLFYIRYVYKTSETNVNNLWTFLIVRNDDILL